jgi:hypothetical protein
MIIKISLAWADGTARILIIKEACQYLITEAFSFESIVVNDS